ncbi:MAG: DUF3305 domain-containing protein [Burkholderiales bacterium]|nr:DUF3305 domain-containing protein [Burkholderiales bacterium]
MEKLARALAVVMERRKARSRWAQVVWQPTAVLESGEPPGAARALVTRDDYQQWLYPGLPLEIHRDEIEGYYMNVSSGSPRVFVLWRMEDEAAGEAGARGLPLYLSASYDEAGRWMDGGHSVDSVAMPAGVFAWVGEYVERNYVPAPKQRRKPRSFVHPKDRVER